MDTPTMSMMSGTDGELSTLPPTPSSHMFTASDTYHTDSLETDSDCGDDDDDDYLDTPSAPEVDQLLKLSPDTDLPQLPDSIMDSNLWGLGLLGRKTSNGESDLDDYDPTRLEILGMSSRALDKAEELARRAWNAGWNVVHHNKLPKWLRDNEFLLHGHRPQLNSFVACFKSIFRIHTETGNIWTHLLGLIAFIAVASYFLSRPSIEIQWQEKAVFSAFFAGAILCMGFSFLFHTVYCHSERMGRLFNKLDYCGIALLTMGSFVPWLYYSFYCRMETKITYLVLIFVLGTFCIIVSMWDKFAEPKYRPVRAGTFVSLGLSGVIPAFHYVITDGFHNAINVAALGWLVLMGFLYIMGAVIYAVRIPERIWPGKFDIWFQSHTIFHLFVLAAAFVHYHGISTIANYRLAFGDCLASE